MRATRHCVSGPARFSFVPAMNLLQVGLGPVGRQIVRFAAARPGVRLVGAVDPAPDLAGRDAGELSGAGRLGVVIQPRLDASFAHARADVAILTTVSDLRALEPQVVELARAGLPIVSTCEALADPWRTHPELAQRLDAVCRERGVACVGTGVNPGFLMDYLPLTLTAVCQRVDRIRVFRVQDASVRRIPFQEKIGAGLTIGQFRERADTGTLRHVGLTESIHMMARRLGWNLSRVTESLDPVVAEKRILSGHRPIEPGQARGVHQVGRGFVGSEERITLDFRAAVGESGSFDRVEIVGEPNLESTIAGGVNGDIATCAIVLNAAAVIRQASPGLRTMIDLPPIAFAAAPAPTTDTGA